MVTAVLIVLAESWPRGQPYGLVIPAHNIVISGLQALCGSKGPETVVTEYNQDYTPTTGLCPLDRRSRLSQAVNPREDQG